MDRRRIVSGVDLRKTKLENINAIKSYSKKQSYSAWRRRGTHPGQIPVINQAPFKSALKGFQKYVIFFIFNFF